MAVLRLVVLFFYPRDFTFICPTICPTELVAFAAPPPPWTVEELSACFVVKDSNGQKVAFVYFEDDPGRRSAVKLLTPANIAKLPDVSV